MAYTKQTWTDRQGTKLNKFIKENETLTTVELTNSPDSITQAGTPFSKTRMDYIEEGIRTGHVIGTPLSDLNRVFHLTGNGIPMLPDNAAGTVCTNRAPEWAVNQCTLSMAGSVLSLTTTGGDPFISRAISMSGSANRYIRVVFDSPISDDLVIFYATSGHSYDGGYQKTIPFAVGKNVLDIDMGSLTVGGSDWISNTITGIRIDFGGVSGVTYKVYGIYVGSGLYDTPVYGKDGQSVWENHGVVPINGERGKAMLFQGAQYLERASGIGAGVVAFRYDRMANGTYEQIIANFDATLKIGYSIYANADNVLALAFGNGTNELSQVLSVGCSADGLHDYVINLSATTIGPIFKDGVQVQSQISLSSTIKFNSSLTRLCAPLWSTSAQMLNGLLESPCHYAETWGADEAMRYHNGDDAVDSQQKAVTPVPHSIVTRDANGGINASNMFAYDLVIDSDAKLAQWAASGTWEKVLIKKGTWTNNAVVNLTDRGTRIVVGEAGSKLVFDGIISSALYYSSTPDKKTTWMSGVTVETKNGTSPRAFFNCVNMTNCSAIDTVGGSGSEKYGFQHCENLTSCHALITGTSAVCGFANCSYVTNCTEISTASAGYATGFDNCQYVTNSYSNATGITNTAAYYQCSSVTNCNGASDATSSGYSAVYKNCDGVSNSRGSAVQSGTAVAYGISNSTHCMLNTMTGETADYYQSYADAGTSYACADTPNGGFNS